MKKYILLMLGISFMAIGISLSACSKDNREVHYKEFPIEIYLKGEIIHIDDTIHHSYPLLTIIEDKLVILDFAAEEYYYHIYGIEEFEYKYSFGKKGRGLNEMLYAQSLVHQDSFMYIDNGNDRSKIIKFVIRESEAVAVDTINTPIAAYIKSLIDNQYPKPVGTT